MSSIIIINLLRSYFEVAVVIVVIISVYSTSSWRDVLDTTLCEKVYK